VKVKSKAYVLELNCGQSKLFGKKIGFRIKRKQEKIFPERYSYDCLSEYIPRIGIIIKKNIKKLGLKYVDIARGLNKGLFSKSGNITYQTLYKILGKCRLSCSKEYKDLKSLVDKKYFYDEIKEIVPIKENVYDFTVNDGHTVTYNGMVGHNTPNGVGNLYHRMFMSEGNGYVKKRYGWWWHYTKEQIEQKRLRMNNPLKFAQEYGLEFLSSGRPVFDRDVIKRQQRNVLKEGEKIMIDTDDGKMEYTIQTMDNLRIYRPPVKDGIYVIGVDVAEGVAGGDYSVAVLWDRITGEEVAFYRGLISPDLFADFLNKWGRLYNNALMVVEINNHGLVTVTCLRHLVYPSMYFRPMKFETIAQRTSDRIGWKTNKVTKPLLIDDLAQAMRDNILTIHSKEILDEMMVFVYNDNGDAVSQQGFHDDTIFASGVGFQGFKVMSDKPLDQLDYEKYLPITYAY